ncbi:hypothetical protein, partial [Rhizorhapis sp. SPR117]|uniref:hypothetical protein n=1 Tax=Rhizorhapis sp. SPR117 TaxID=2912611 RepID=UPI001F435920|nr:hypothetical protein [Rhizorhapis sp. SPR117]
SARGSGLPCGGLGFTFSYVLIDHPVQLPDAHLAIPAEMDNARCGGAKPFLNLRNIAHVLFEYRLKTS